MACRVDDMTAYAGMLSSRTRYRFLHLPCLLFRVFGIVTSRDTEGSELINWLHARCGKSEEAYSIMKEDLPGEKLPSAGFGENAA